MHIRVQVTTLAVAALGFAGAGAGLAAQGKLAPTTAPIDIMAQPPVVVAGGEVMLRGSSLTLKDLTTVRIEIQPPKGAVEKLEARLDKNDSYSVKYRPRAVGKHVVTAFSPGGKSQAKATFDAVTAGGASDRSTKALSAMATATRGLADAVCKAAKSLPPSPPQQKLATDGCALVTELETVPAAIESFRKALTEVDKTVEAHPETLIELGVAYVDLAEIEVTAKTAETDLKERTQKLNAGITTCDSLDLLVDAYEFIGLVWNIPTQGLKRINDLIADRLLPERVTGQFPQLASTPIWKRFVDMGIPTLMTAARGVMTKWQYVTDRATNIAAGAADVAMRAFCEKFVGPIEGRLDLEYFEGNSRWLAYTIVLDGFVTLRYEKGKALAGGTPVTGEFEGVARFPTLREDLRAIQPAVAPHVFARKAWTPALGSLPFAQPELGKFGRAAAGALRAAPGYFFVPVEGLLRDKTLMLKFKPANVDYPKRALGKIGYVLWSPQMLFPQVFKFDVEFQGAHYILSRAVQKKRGASAEPFPLTVVVDEARKISLIEQKFTRTEEDPGSFRLRWNLQVKACNPSCPPGS